MNMNEYLSEVDEVHKEHDLKLHALREEWVEKNKKFNVGDYVFNVTGIIKVKTIGYVAYPRGIEVAYHGYRYKNVKGELSRTKDKKITSMREEINCVKLLRAAQPWPR